jgi:hypothetical protein
MVEAVQKQMQAVAIRAVGEVLMACLDTEVTVKLGREKGAPRQISEQPREIQKNGRDFSTDSKRVE